MSLLTRISGLSVQLSGPVCVSLEEAGSPLVDSPSEALLHRPETLRRLYSSGAKMDAFMVTRCQPRRNQTPERDPHRLYGERISHQAMSCWQEQHAGTIAD